MNGKSTPIEFDPNAERAGSGDAPGVVVIGGVDRYGTDENPVTVDEGAWKKAAESPAIAGLVERDVLVVRPARERGKVEIENRSSSAFYLGLQPAPQIAPRTAPAAS